MDTIFNGLNTSEKIRLLMASKDVTKTELGKLLGVTDETVRNWMRADAWDKNDLIKVAEHLGVGISDLI